MQAFAEGANPNRLCPWHGVELPLHVERSSRNRWVDLADRRQRLRTYEAVLREGRPEDVEAIVDGVLLIDGWAEMVLPRSIHAAWQPLIDEVEAMGNTVTLEPAA